MKRVNSQLGLFCMNKGWKFSREENSVLPKERTHRDVYGFTKAGRAEGPAGSMFDDSGWGDVTLPHDWVTTEAFNKNAAMNHGYKERGCGWYRMKFLLEESARDKQILLEFEGMSAESLIYVNGQLLHRNHSGYQGFCVDMTDVANFGKTPNVIAIKIDAESWEGWWYEGAGIYRNVWLIQKSKTHIAWHGIHVKPKKIEDEKWKVDVDVTLENSSEKEQEAAIVCTVSGQNYASIRTEQNDCQVGPYTSRKFSFELMMDEPKLWSIETPELYNCHVELYYGGILQDYFDVLFGCRTIRFDAEEGFFLNGESVKIKGFCNHQDHAGIGVAVPYTIKEYRIKQLLKTGANAYRCAHNTDPEILDICDRLGMLVMEENRVFSTEPYALNSLKEMVKEARNHPCVILYSLFNEESLQGSDKGQRMAAKMRYAVRKEDTSRPVLGAFNGGYLEEGAGVSVDIMGMNYSAHMYDEYHKRFPYKPMVASETASTFAVRGEYITEMEKHIIDNFDEHYAAWGNSARDAWRLVAERPFVAGEFVWTGFDYRGEPTPFAWPSVASFFGVFDSCGFPKDAFWLYRAMWKEEAMVHIAPHWTFQVPSGEKVKITTFSNCDEVELILNGISLGKKKADGEVLQCFEVPYHPGRLEAIGYHNGEKAAEDVCETANVVSKLYLESNKSVLWADESDAVVINVYAHDENGNVVPYADNQVWFEVSGGAYIAGVGNGNPNCLEADVAETRTLFHGCAQAIIRVTGEENVKVRAISKDVQECVLEIPVKKREWIPAVELTKEKIIGNWRMYKSVFDDFPIMDKDDENDQNSFEPIQFQGKPQPQYRDNYEKYGVYRTELNMECVEEGSVLVFPKINGQVWVYVEGVCCAKRMDVYKGELKVQLPASLCGYVSIAVVIRNMDWKWFETGILEPVYLRVIN